MDATCREFLVTTIVGIALTVTPLSHLVPGRGRQTARATTVDPAYDWQGGPGVARARIDGYPKVTDRKIYARDLDG